MPESRLRRCRRHETCPACQARQGEYAYWFDSNRRTATDWIVGRAPLVALISLFLSWVTASLAMLGVTGSAPEAGTDTHGQLWLVFGIALSLAHLIALAGFTCCHSRRLGAMRSCS